MNISLDSNDINTAVINFLEEEYAINLQGKTCKVNFVMGRGDNGLRAEIEIIKSEEPIQGYSKVPGVSHEKMIEALEDADLIQKDEDIGHTEVTKPLFVDK